MSINRIVRTSGFTTIPNEVLRDARLSFRARGVLAMVLTHTDDWTATSGWITDNGTEGRDAVRRALHELEAVGYRRVERVQAANGTWSTVTYWYDSAGKPTPENPYAGGSGAIQKTIQKTNTPPPPTGGETVDDGFDEWWSVYPKKVDKQAARRAWKRASKMAEIRVLVDAAARYRDDPDRKPEFTKNPSTWLNAGSWENGHDEPLPEEETVDRRIGDDRWCQKCLAWDNGGGHTCTA